MENFNAKSDRNQQNKDAAEQAKAKQVQEEKDKLQKKQSGTSPYIKDMPPIDPARPGIL